MKAPDLEAVLEIQARSLEAAGWSQEDYKQVIRGNLWGWVGEKENALFGFLVARVAGGELEILNLAVLPEARGQGIGSLLILEALRSARSCGASRAHLEVRASNETARRFYEHHGFAVLERRPRYYAEPVEDALLFSAELV